MRYEPRDYQRNAGDHIIDHPASGVFIDCGMGKTVVDLTAFDDLRNNRFEVSNNLVVAPKRVAESTWSKEVDKWDHLRGMRVSLIAGDAKQRVTAAHKPADLYVVSRDNLVWLIEHFGRRWPFQMVTLDESTSFKNPKAKRVEALKEVKDAGLIQRITLLSGTPSPRSYLDLWSQVYLMDGGERLYPKFEQYRMRYFQPGKVGQMPNGRQVVYRWDLLPGARETILKNISDICISLKAEDYLELPEVLENDISVELDPEAKAAYTRFERETILRMIEEEGFEHVVEAGSAGVLTNKLLQLCNGSMYDELKAPVKVHSCKTAALKEQLEGMVGQPTFVLYQFQFDVPEIIAAAKAAGIDDEDIRVMKTTKDEDDWNAGKIQVLIMHPASCGKGLNLQAGGNQMIWYSLPWNYEDYYQTMRRLARPGQQAPRVIMHRLLVSGGMDEDVAGSLTGKGESQEYLLRALRMRVQRVAGAGRGYYGDR